MSSVDIGNLAYLVLLAAVLVFWLFVQNRDSLGKKAQAAAAWGLIFLGTVAAIGLWDDIRQTVTPRQSVFAEQGRIELPRAPDGHYYVTLGVNGAPIRFHHICLRVPEWTDFRAACDAQDFPVVMERDLGPDALRFIERAATEGVGAVVADRDGPFGDCSQAPPGEQPDPSHVIEP